MTQQRDEPGGTLAETHHGRCECRCWQPALTIHRRIAGQTIVMAPKACCSGVGVILLEIVLQRVQCA